MAYKKRIAGITIEIDGDTSKLVKSLDNVSTKVGRIGRSLERFGGKLTTNLTVPIVTAGGIAISKFAEVDKTMTLTNETMGNTAEEANMISQAMKDAAANSVYGMDEAATASLNFARAGLSAEEAASALAPAMNLAAGEGGNLDIVSGGLVATLNGFGDSFSNAGHYADVFANACNNSALDVDSLADSMSIAAPVFSAAGYSVEDAALYMGIMANAGIEAGEAANALKTGMARLVKPAKEGAEWMDKLGISVTNSDGSMKDTATIQKELHDAFANLSESEQIAASSAIFGKNQMAKWLALINTAPSEVDSLAQSIDKEGTATEMAEAMMSGFGGSIEKLKSTLDVLMTSLGELASQYLTPVIEKIQGIIDKFLALDDETKQRIIKIAGIVATVGPVILVIGKVISGISGIISVVSGLAAVLPLLAGPFGIVLGIIAAVVAIGVLLYKNWDWIKEKASELGDWIKEKFEFIKLVVTKTWEFIKEKAIETWNNIKETVSNVWNGIKDKVQNSAIGQAVGKVWDAAKKTMTDNLSAMKKAYDEHGGGLKGTVAAMMEGVKRQYTAGFDFLNNLTGGKLDKIKEKVSNIFNKIKETVAGVFDGIKDKITAVIDFIKNLFSGELSFPHIKIPHFHIEGGQVPWGIGGKGTPPDISIDWYKKAMNEPYVLNGATIFGSMGGRLLGGGESGSEMIIGTNKLMQMIGQAKGGDTTINNQFVINGADQDPRSLAHEISYYLDMELKRTSGAFA